MTLESTSTSRKLFAFLAAALLTILLLSLPERAEPAAAGAAEEKTDRTLQPEDEDFSTTPFTDYAEFNEAEEEDENTRFFQYGRFFGVSLGMGFEGITGNRGSLWQGGFPLVDFRIHYWFDFNFALRLGLQTVSHNYDAAAGHTDVTVVNLFTDLAYYIITKDLSSAIAFGNPYVLVGIGSLAKTETSAGSQTSQTDSTVAFEAGFGLEFALKPRKVYFQFEGKYKVATFKDTNTTTFQNRGLSDLNGSFYTFGGSILFTW